MNYTDVQTKYMIEIYNKSPNRNTVEALAKEFNKSIKSIIGKLSREGVYRREVYKTKTGDDPVTKLQLVSQIAEYLGTEENTLLGLEKTPKLVLKKIVEILETNTVPINQ